MDIKVKINAVEKQTLVDWRTFKIDDLVNERANTCNFTIKNSESKTYRPSTGDSIQVLDGAATIFGGGVVSVETEMQGGVVFCNVQCRDYTYLLDRKLVTETFSNKSVDYIIDYIVNNYLAADGVTAASVNCATVVTTATFNGLPVSKCIQDLADMMNYSWYIDYNKNIHFFAKNAEAAPFNLTDSSNNFLQDSIKITSDLSQMRNVVRIEGGEKTATNTRTKTHTGDGTQKTFNTDYKFATMPVVKVATVAKVVGVENIDSEAGKDAMWDYNQKYVRFIAAPAAAAAIELTGNPLIPIIVQVEDAASISKNGKFEFKKTDKNIKSSDEANKFASAQLEAYGASVKEGGFKTYTSGLQSGQTISINLTKMGVADTFIINRVTLSMTSPTAGIWDVDLATQKTIGIIAFLQRQITDDSKKLELNENEVIDKYYQDNQTVQVTEEISVKTKVQDFIDVQVAENIAKDPFGAGVKPDFVVCPYEVTSNSDIKREFLMDRSYLG